MTARYGLAIAALLAAISGCDRVDGVAEGQPPPDHPYRLHFQIVAANGGGSPSAHLAPVEDELRKVFRFDEYSVIGEGYVMVSSGDFSLSITSTMQRCFDHSDDGWVQQRPLQECLDDSQLALNPISLRHDINGSVSLDMLRLNVTYDGRALRTQLRFWSGQTFVLGSMHALGETFFVVVHVAQVEDDPA